MNKDIADDHHVVRWVPKTLLAHDESERVVGFHPYAFQLKTDRGEPYLSASWAEYFKQDLISNVLSAARGMVPIVNVRKSGAFAVGRAGKIREAAQKTSGLAVRVHWAGTTKQPAYAHVYDIPPDDLALLSALANRAWSGRLSAVAVLADH